MFRAMRRSRQAMPQEECAAVLERGSHGVLALAGDGDYPYAVPISYVYTNRKLYFHCAKSGHKLDAIGRCPKASFCVVDQDQVEPLAYTTHYRSVIAFGTIRVLEDDREKRAAIEALAVKYAPEDSVEHRERYIQQDWASVCLLEMAIDHLSGKEERELARERRWEQGVDCAGC